MNQINSFTLKGRGVTAAECIPVVKTHNVEYVLLRIGEEKRAVRLDDEEGRPITRDSDKKIFLQHAALARKRPQGGGPLQNVLTRPTSNPGVILFIDCRQLNFGWEPAAEGLNLWPGGESPTVQPFALCGGHTGAQKMLLFNFFADSEFYVVDTCKCVARVSVDKNRGLVLTETGPRELITLIGKKALQQNTVRALDWGIHNLDALGAVDEKERLRKKRRGLAA